MSAGPERPPAEERTPKELNVREREDLPDLIVKLQERRETHRERGRLYRSGVVAVGFVLVLVGIVLSGPGVPGPGFLVILIGLGLLALEFTWAERTLERVILAADRLKDRAERMSTRTKVLLGLAAALVVAALVLAAILWDIPLLPV